MTSKAKYPADTIILPGEPRGRVMCCNDPCYGRKFWNIYADESPECIMCAAAWHEIESAPGFRGHGNGFGSF